MKKIINKLFKRNGTDMVITVCVLFLTIFGIVMIGSACMGQTATKGAEFAVSTMIKQAIYAVFGICGLVFFSRTYKKSWVNNITCTLFSILGIAAMLFCLAFDPVKDAQAWIRIGPATIQPAEFMKIILIIVFSYVFSDFVRRYTIPRMLPEADKKQLRNVKFIYCFVIPLILLLTVFIVGWKLQNDLGSMLIVLFISGIIFLCTNERYYRPYKKMALVFAGGCLLLLIVAGPFILRSHQINRFTTFMSPLADPYNEGFHLSNSLISLTSSLFGKGFGNSLQKYGFIPESHNDFIFPIIFEELGIIGLLCVFVPYCYIIFKLFYYSTKIKDEQDRLILIGISSYFFAHLFINIGGVTGMIPMTGVPLLFVSNGGSSLIAAMCAIGVAQAIIARMNRRNIKEQL